jgi:hypothetical protein
VDGHLLASELLHHPDLQPAPKNNSCIPWGQRRSAGPAQ